MRWMAVLSWRLPPRVETVAVGLAGADRDRCDAGRAGELGLGGEALGAGDLAEELRRGQRPEAGLLEQLRRDLSDQLRDLRLELVGGHRELAQAPQLVPGDPDTRGLLDAGQAPRDPRRPLP